MRKYKRKISCYLKFKLRVALSWIVCGIKLKIRIIWKNKWAQMIIVILETAVEVVAIAKNFFRLDRMDKY